MRGIEVETTVLAIMPTNIAMISAVSDWILAR